VGAPCLFWWEIVYLILYNICVCVVVLTVALHHVMYCYVLLYIVMYCYVLLCIVMLCYAMLCFVMLCNAMQFNVMHVYTYKIWWQ
jgi:hypothetical protein